MGFDINTDGNTSEWNEALFKMMRLHKIQTEINVEMMTPLTRGEGGEFGYKVAFQLITRLYKEGEAKYTTKEREEIDLIKSTIEKLLTKCPVHTTRINKGYGGTKKIDIFNNSNWEMIKGLIEVYERKVKFYNDIHGLSTKNAENLNSGSIIR